MGIDSTINLVVASLDLKLVQLVRGAIRTADLHGQAERATPVGLAPPAGPRVHLHPDPVIDPRPNFHPTPRIGPCGVCLPACSRAPSPQTGAGPAEPVAPPPADAVAPACPTEMPLQPPWKVLPWQNPPPPAPVKGRKVKIVRYRSDTLSIGSMVDCFI